MSAARHVPASDYCQVYTPARASGWAFLGLAVRDSPIGLPRHRELICAMAARDLKALNKGAFLGLAWVVIRPLIQTLAYVVIVSYLLGSARLGAHERLGYALYVLSGMIPWQILTRTLESAPSLVRERTDLVKQVIYPIETLPLTDLLVSACGSLVSLAVFLVASLAAGEASWSLVLLPVPMLLLALFSIGMSWLAMIVGAVVKDLREAVALLLGLAVYVSPVVLRQEFVSPAVWNLVLLNPLSHVIVCFRDVYQGSIHPASWCIFGLMTGLSLIAGSAAVARAKRFINEYI